MNLTDENRLIDRVQNGDQRAFGELVKKYDRNIFNLLLNILKNEADAEDAYQTVFIKAYQNIGRFNRDSGFYTWLYRIAINTAYTFHAKRSRENTPLVNDDIETVESIFKIGCSDSSLEDDEERQLVRAEVDKLSFQQKSVLYLKSYEGKKFTEIAGILSINTGTAKAYFHRAVQNIRAALGCREDKDER